MEENNLYCNECSLTFNNESEYNTHLSNVHKKTNEQIDGDTNVVKLETKYSTKSSGGFDFSTSTSSQIDQLGKNKKPNKCLICDYSCNQKGTLKIHIESVHEDTLENGIL